MLGACVGILPHFSAMVHIENLPDDFDLEQRQRFSKKIWNHLLEKDIFISESCFYLLGENSALLGIDEAGGYYDAKALGKTERWHKFLEKFGVPYSPDAIIKCWLKRVERFPTTEVGRFQTMRDTDDSSVSKLASLFPNESD